MTSYAEARVTNMFDCTRSHRQPGMTAVLHRCGGHACGCEQDRDAVRRSGSAPTNTEPDIVHRVLGTPGEPLEQPLAHEMATRLGPEAARARIHTGGEAAGSARAVDAEAYSVGPHVVFGAGRFRPETPDGRRLLAHELAHVVQAPSDEMPAQSLEISQPTDLHEREAEQVAAGAVRAVPGSAPGATLSRQLYPPLPMLPNPLPDTRMFASTAIEVTAVDTSVETSIEWYKPWRYTGPISGALRGDVSMTDIASMVTNVLKYLAGRKMGRLNILDHGYEQGVQIGTEWLTSAADVKMHAPDLSRLRGQFSSGGLVHLQNCHAGANKDVMCALADAIGVPVYGGTGLHNPVLNFNLGDYVSCRPGGVWNPAAGRPLTPAAPPEPKA
jgi:hypothetical protein